jgi:hypothetical protein
MDIAKQFIGRITWITLSTIVIAHIIAFCVKDTYFELALMIMSAIFIAVITWRSLFNGLLVAFAEIFIGGHGHLFDFDIFGFSLSIRMIIFLVIFCIWLLKIKTNPPRYLMQRDTPWAILLIAVVIGTINGYFNNNVANVFDDMNGYVIIGYLLPIISIDWTQTKRKELLEMLFGCFIWISTFTIALAYLFTHTSGDFLHTIYTFVRDSRLAEITLQVIDNKGSLMEIYLTEFFPSLNGEYWYRIFMPSQLVSILAVLLSYGAMIFLWRGERLPIFVRLFFIFSILTVLISLSRSFLLGCVFALLALFISAWFFGCKKLSIVSVTIKCFVLSFIAILAIYAIVEIPVPQRPDLTDAAFFETSSQTGRTEAVISRWNLLDKMMIPILENPILGSGFGKTVSYHSQDPRIIDELGDTEYTTYRFEWGWHDVWLKMGLLGLIAFGWYFISIMRAGWYSANKHGYSWLTLGLLSSIIALFVTNIFSPYINHPLGIGIMLFVLPFFDFEGLNKKQKENIQKQKTHKPIAQALPATFCVKK